MTYPVIKTAREPQRIQLSRAKGWRKPEGAVVVARPTVFGNLSACNWGPDPDHHCTRCDPDAGYCCIDRFREYVFSGLENRPSIGGTLNVMLDAMAGYPRRTDLTRRLPELRGRDLACWCALDRPCHADVLLELANAPEREL